MYFIKVMGLRQKKPRLCIEQRIPAPHFEYYTKAGDCKSEIPDRATKIFWPNCFIYIWLPIFSCKFCDRLKCYNKHHKF